MPRGPLELPQIWGSVDDALTSIPPLEDICAHDTVSVSRRFANDEGEFIVYYRLATWMILKLW